MSVNPTSVNSNTNSRSMVVLSSSALASSIAGGFPTESSSSTMQGQQNVSSTGPTFGTASDGSRIEISHPPPRAPSPSKHLQEQQTSTADPFDELNALADQMGGFKWSEDVIENCRRLMQGFARPGESSLVDVVAAKSKGVSQLKQLLCTSRDKVFEIAQDAIDGQLLPILVEIVDDLLLPTEVRLGAAFCLTNVAAGHDSQTAAVVHAGALTPMISLLKSPNESLRRQAVFCLANIAGSTPEYRRALAEHPAYFDSVIHAVTNTMDKRIEELAAWNLRNMCVLGGPPVHALRSAIEFFADQIHKNCPPDILCREALAVNFRLARPGGGGGCPEDFRALDDFGSFRTAILSSSSSSALHAAAFQLGHPLLRHSVPNVSFSHRSGGGIGESATCCETPAILRFASEAMSWVSRSPEGRSFIANSDLILPLLYLGRFSINQSVRNGVLESLANVMMFASSNVRRMFEEEDGVEVCAEILADPIQYNPHQRAWASRCLIAVTSDLGPYVADEMLEKKIITADAARKLRNPKLVKSVLMQSVKSKINGGEGGGHIGECLGGGGSLSGRQQLEEETHHRLDDETPRIRGGGGGGDGDTDSAMGGGGEGYAAPSRFDAELPVFFRATEHSDIGMKIEEELAAAGFGDSYGSGRRADVEDDAALSRCYHQMQDRKGRLTPLLDRFGVSVLEIAYRIYYQTDTLEDHFLREHSVLLMVAILTSASDAGLTSLLSTDMIKLFVDILEFMADADAKSLLSGSAGLVVSPETDKVVDWTCPDFFPAPWDAAQHAAAGATAPSSTSTQSSQPPVGPSAVLSGGSVINAYTRAFLALGQKWGMWLNFLVSFLEVFKMPSAATSTNNNVIVLTPRTLPSRFLAQPSPEFLNGGGPSSNSPTATGGAESSGSSSSLKAAAEIFLGTPYSLASLYLFVRLISLGEDLKTQECLDANPIGTLIERASGSAGQSDLGGNNSGNELKRRIEMAIASSPLPMMALRKVMALIQQHCTAP